MAVNLSPHAATSRCRSRAVVTAVVLLLTVHAGLLAWGAWRHSPAWDEVGHLPAGISHWRFGRFDLYRVNPPLVRMVAVLPVLAARPKTDWSGFQQAPGARPEWAAGRALIEANGQRSFWLFTLARWGCLPFSLLGGYLCFRWARDLYGSLAGILALTLWSFSPNIIAHGQMITPDVGATTLGLAACYAFWHWLKGPNWPRTLTAGTVLGLAELTKMTWVVLFALWPVLWAAWRWPQPNAEGGTGKETDKGHSRSRKFVDAWPRETCQMAVILLLGVYVLNLGYGFEGSFQKLGEFQFVSEMLGEPGHKNDPRYPREARNRFRETWMAAMPIPLPENYVLGIDQQKWEFENKMWSYLRGEWRLGGWWYYYLYALAIKVPLGTWILVLLAPLLGLTARGYTASWRDELILLAPLLVVLTLVSSQTGFNHHMRYVLPIFPFAFIWASKVARAVELKHWKITSVVGAALLWSVGSSLWVYPHSLSYFNELVGGPTGGHAHLLDSNTDWGQDLLYLKRWLDRHPEVRLTGFAYSLPSWLVDPRLAGIECPLPPRGPDAVLGNSRVPDDQLGPRPGWYAVCVRPLRERAGEYAYFLRFDPVDMVGYSVYIYHISLNEANRVRRDFGLPELPEGWQPAEKSRDDESGSEAARRSGALAHRAPDKGAGGATAAGTDGVGTATQARLNGALTEGNL